MSIFRSTPEIASRHMLSFLYPAEAIRPLRRRTERNPPYRRSLAAVSISSDGVESLFFDSIAAASNCRKHKTRVFRPCILSPSHRPTISYLRGFPRCPSYCRQQHSAVCVEELEPIPNRTKEELMALVDQYTGDSFTDQLPLLELPNLYQPSNTPEIRVSDKEEDEWPPPYSAWPATPETKLVLQSLDKSLRQSSPDPEALFQLYRSLPSPRAPYLEAAARHRLLHRLAIVEKKDKYSMIRYFSILDDMKATAIPLSVSEWTSAISFAARYVDRSTEVEIEAALHMWKEMERVAGVKGNHATFNVLYDVACKAGKFTLADMIYHEMATRGLEFNRFHHVSRIHFCGLQSDGDGARAAYRALIEAGEMVDTIALNAMIAALIQSHEVHAAENVYERMKNIYLEDTGAKLPSRDYKSKRQIRYSLLKMARTAKSDPSKKGKLQKQVVIAPDVHTYRILVNYFAVHAGELDKAAKFLDEMKFFEIPVHGAMFLALFKGFAMHGGIRYTQWTKSRLENAFDAFIHAIDEHVEGLYISKWTTIWSLRAFARCSGKERTLKAWEQLKERWHPEEAELDHVLGTLRHILDAADTAEKDHDTEWILGEL